MTQRPEGHGNGTDASTAGHAASQAGRAAEIWEDWITIWQSELNAMATDREMQLAFMRLVTLWADNARAAGAWLPDGSAGRPGPEPSSGPAASAAAPDARDLAIERLAQRVEELERRLGGLDRSKPVP